MVNKSVKLIVERLVENLSEPPRPTIKLHGTGNEVNRMIRNTALQTSTVSAALSIPGGVSGLITVLPEVTSIWKMQAQMISNIAAVHGKESQLSREQMLWCMFRQMGIGIFKEFVIQQGGTYLVKKMKAKSFEAIIQKLGINLLNTQGKRMVGKVIPVVGSLSAGALTFHDTRKVGKNADRLYSSEIHLLR